MADNKSIGVFDSGLGGLTVVRELLSYLPNEEIVYFGDTGRVPYGGRSDETIIKYAMQDERFLLDQGVKLIIAACGTVSSVAAHTGKSLPVPFIEVVTPAAQAAVEATKNKKIGVIGTSATVKSGAYEKKIKSFCENAEVFSADCPIFVPLVEAGWIEKGDVVTRETVQRYLQPLKEKGVDTLILGCTHYPVLSDFISEFMGEDVTLINTGLTAALHTAEFMRENGLLCERDMPPKHHYFVSDHTDSFTKVANILLGQNINGAVSRVSVTKY